MQHEAYCRLRMSGHSRAKAYNLAFNKPEDHKWGRQSAYQLEKKTPEILRRIEDLQSQAAGHVLAKVAVKNDYIFDTYKEVIERSMQSEPVLDREGNETGEYKFDARSAVAALNSLARINGLFDSGSQERNEEASKNEQQLLEEYHKLNEQLQDALQGGDTGEALSGPEGTDEAEGIPVQPIPEAG